MIHSPSSNGVSKRKQACLGCRSRKKKCDAIRPSCTPCRKWNVVCDYTSSGASEPRRPIPTILPKHVTHHEPTYRSDERLSNDGDSAHTNRSISNDGSQSREGSNDDNHTLPSLVVVKQLLEIFISNCCKFIPCFHHASLRADIERGELQRTCPPLLFAILAVAAPKHPDISVRQSQKSWIDSANALYDLTTRDSLPALRVQQAAICVVFLSLTTTDYSRCWLVLGRAWRQACIMGFNRVDSKMQHFQTFVPGPSNEREKEEWRRIMWTLFLFDRGNSYPAGWPHAIDPKQFAAKKPIGDDVFQAMTDDSVVPSQIPTQDTLFLQLFKCHELLGDVVEHIYILEPPDDPHAYLNRLKDLDRKCDNFRNILHASLEQKNLSEDQYAHLMWSGLMNTTAVVLLNQHSKEDWNLLSHESIPNEEWLSPETCFLRCVDICQEMINVINRVPGRYSDALLNPFTAAALYICTRPLVMRWFETHSADLRKAISTSLHLTDQYAELFPPLGKKFKSGIEFCLESDADRIREMRDSGAKINLQYCNIWFERSKIENLNFVPGKLTLHESPRPELKQQASSY